MKKFLLFGTNRKRKLETLLSLARANNRRLKNRLIDRMNFFFNKKSLLYLLLGMQGRIPLNIHEHKSIMRP